MVPRFIISLAFVFLFFFPLCVFIGYKSTRIISKYIYILGGEGEWVLSAATLASVAGTRAFSRSYRAAFNFVWYILC